METNAISTSHIEAKKVVTKRVIVFGKTLYRELGGKKLTETVEVNGKKNEIDSPFTLINAKDVATGEVLTQGIFIPHRGAELRKLEHLIVDETAYPKKCNIICTTTMRFVAKIQYNVTLIVRISSFINDKML